MNDKMNFDDSNGDIGDEDLNMIKDIYLLRIKTILAKIKKISFEEFLKEHFEIDIAVSPSDLFQNVIIDSIFSVEFGIKEKDDELIHYVDLLITKLEQEDEEDSTLAKLFAKLLAKAKSVCQAGLPIKRTGLTFEYLDFMKEFDEKIVATSKNNSEKLYNEAPRYSDN